MYPGFPARWGIGNPRGAWWGDGEELKDIPIGFWILDQGLKAIRGASQTPPWLLLLQNLAGSQSEAVRTAQD